MCFSEANIHPVKLDLYPTVYISDDSSGNHVIIHCNTNLLDETMFFSVKQKYLYEIDPNIVGRFWVPVLVVYSDHVTVYDIRKIHNQYMLPKYGIPGWGDVESLIVHRKMGYMNKACKIQTPQI